MVPKGVPGRGARCGAADLLERGRVHPQGLCDHHVQVGQAFLKAAELGGRLTEGS